MASGLLGAAVGRRALLVTAAGGLLGLGGTGLGGLATGDPAVGGAPRRRLYVIGDSWAAGLHADPDRALGQVAAHALGFASLVDAASGTGYLQTTPDGDAYPARAGRIPDGTTAELVVLQGGSNDDGQDHTRIPAAFAATVAAVRARIPGAAVLALGPGPDPQPVTAVQRDVDLVLQQESASLGVPYVSMLQEDWIPVGSDVLDPSNHHPTTTGQRYLGLKLALALLGTFPEVAG